MTIHPQLCHSSPDLPTFRFESERKKCVAHVLGSLPGQNTMDDHWVCEREWETVGLNHLQKIDKKYKCPPAIKLGHGRSTI